jgi:UPF0042 nucleotide-binding protein
MDIIIVTGMSGAGKSCAINCFEDLGYYCIDNLPPALIRNVLDLMGHGKRELSRAVFVIDIRGGEFFDDLKAALTDMKAAVNDCRILFLDAADDVLLRRYSETRRAHPLAGGDSNLEGVGRERRRLAEVRRLSDVIIDTSKMKTAALNEEIKRLFLPGGEDVFQINIMSFGYKYGVPAEADMVFDMRFIPNQFYVQRLKDLTGNNKKVRVYVMSAGVSRDFRDSALNLMDKLIPAFSKEGKYRLGVAFGCTGGRHRSVSMAVVFDELLKGRGYKVTLTHRDL